MNPYISGENLRTLPIHVASPAFQDALTEFFKKAELAQASSGDLYARAESCLLGALKLSDWQPPLPLAYTSTCSTAFAAGRLDAEHFQPRYDALLTHLRDHAPRLGTVRDFSVLCDRGEQPKYFEDGSLAVVNSRHILESGLDYDNFERTDAALWNHPAFASAHILRGDILTYTTGAKIGRTAVYLSDERALASNHVNILRLREENSVYVAVALNSLIGRMQTRRDCTGSAQVELYPSDIARFTVPFVDEEVQKQIVSDVEASHISRRRAKYLLSAARRAVEAAIEEGEDAGLSILRAAQEEAQ